MSRIISQHQTDTRDIRLFHDVLKDGKRKKRISAVFQTRGRGNKQEVGHCRAGSRWRVRLIKWSFLKCKGLIFWFYLTTKINCCTGKECKNNRFNVQNRNLESPTSCQSWWNDSHIAIQMLNPDLINRHIHHHPGVVLIMTAGERRETLIIVLIGCAPTPRPWRPRRIVPSLSLSLFSFKANLQL